MRWRDEDDGGDDDDRSSKLIYVYNMHIFSIL